MINYEQVKKEATHLNTAFVEAFVSYAAYDKRRWMMEKVHTTTIENSSNPVLQVLKQAHTSAEELTTRKVFELYASLFNKNKFESVMLDLPSTGNYKSKKYGYETAFESNNGDYQALNNLARAIIVRSKNPDDTYTLHLSFRGTDTDARTFKNFVTDAYLDMSAYYEAFKPLEESLLSYVQDKGNKISKINISGHSLGGSMVSEFLKSKEVQNCNIPMEGFTYGAPGNVKKPFYGILPAIYHTLKHGKFLQLGKAILDLGIYFKSKPDERITHYSHTGDLIPRVAALVYEKEGNLITLEDIASDNKQESFILSGKSPASFASTNFMPRKSKFKSQDSNLETPSIDDAKMHYKKIGTWGKTKEFFHKAVTFQFHDMLRYVINIDNQAQKLVNKINNQEDITLKAVLRDSIPDILDFNEYRQKFEKVTTFNENNLGEYITNRINQNLKMQAIQKGTWGGALPENTNLSKKITSLRQEAFAKKVVKGLEQELTGMKFGST